MMTNPTACDWTGCPVVARFHIQIPLDKARLLGDAAGLQLPFTHSHHNLCASHFDRYSAALPPLAIYLVGKCPHCNAM
jgi:hypothetical protein